MICHVLFSLLQYSPLLFHFTV